MDYTELFCTYYLLYFMRGPGFCQLFLTDQLGHPIQMTHDRKPGFPGSQKVKIKLTFGHKQAMKD